VSRRRSPITARWTLSLGANVVDGGVRFAVWAPKARTVDVELTGEVDGPARYVPLVADTGRIYTRFAPGVVSGARYRFRIDGAALYPDPWSRSQPDGVHGPSEVVDPARFRWTDDRWTGVSREDLIIYELHVGTFTDSGTFDGVARELPYLRRLGVTAIELMPVAEFPGSRNWGYDGVDLFAPSRNYGGVTALKRLVDRAHRVGIAVILDVVYNHFGPDGNYLRAFSDSYFTDRHTTPWGAAINYDRPESDRVRQLIVENACYWLVEYHLDGLRLDATHEIHDASEVHLLSEICRRTREVVGDERRIFVMAEDDRRDVSLIRPPARAGHGLDAVWADDFHHAVHVLLTGERDGYYAAYAGTASEIATAVSRGFVYQGQWSAYHGARRSAPVRDEPASAFIFCVQNHDQVGNRAFGERLNNLIEPERYVVAVALLLFVPEVPLLFMGQEFAANTPFQYFTDHEPALGELVTRGRRQEFAKFAAFRDPTSRSRIPDPQNVQTFLDSRLRASERVSNGSMLRLHRDLIRLRRTDPVLAQCDRANTRAIAVGERCVVIRRWSDIGERILIANAGASQLFDLDGLDLEWPERNRRWRLVLSTGWRRYGGEVTRRQPRLIDGRLAVPSKTALLYAAH
jgi:maltooligosyltrehalose trehalohydrolase